MATICYWSTNRAAMMSCGNDLTGGREQTDPLGFAQFLLSLSYSPRVITFCVVCDLILQ